MGFNISKNVGFKLYIYNFQQQTGFSFHYQFVRFCNILFCSKDISSLGRYIIFVHSKIVVGLTTLKKLKQKNKVQVSECRNFFFTKNQQQQEIRIKNWTLSSSFFC